MNLKHHAERKKPATKHHLLHDSIYMQCPNQAKLVKVDGRLLTTGGNGEREQGLTANEYKFLFGMMKFSGIRGDGCTTQWKLYILNE